LHRWGAPIVQKSRWVGCRLREGGLWIVAPVRSRPAAPPPTGVERRSRERLVLELAGLSLGAIAAAEDGSRRRLAPAEALWELARQPSVIAHEVGNPLAVALGNLDLGLDAIRHASLAELDGRCGRHSSTIWPMCPKASSKPRNICAPSRIVRSVRLGTWRASTSRP